MELDGSVMFMADLYDGTRESLAAAANQANDLDKAIALTGLLGEVLTIWKEEDAYHNVFAELVGQVLSALRSQPVVEPKPLEPVVQDTGCPKCLGTGEFSWPAKDGSMISDTCWDCGGSGLVTAQQATFRAAHRPRVLQERAPLPVRPAPAPVPVIPIPAQES